MSYISKKQSYEHKSFKKPSAIYTPNESKRDKTYMVQKSNRRITDRDMDEVEINRDRYTEGMNVDRIMLERQMTSQENNHDDDKFIGEITKDEIDPDIYDKGMPVRSSFTVKQSKYDNNSHLDLNLFEKVDKSNDSINYSDLSTGEYSGLDDALKPITKESNPYESCVTDICSTTCWMHSNIFEISNNSYIVNGFGLFTAFGVIYLINHGSKIELELKNYFGFQDKRHLNAGLLTLRDEMIKYRDQIIMDSFIINDKDIPLNKNIVLKLKKLIFNVTINRNYLEQETVQVNKIINHHSRMGDVVSLNTLAKSRIILLMVAKLNPVWTYKIDNIVKGVSHKSPDLVSYISFVGKTFGYHEDTERQVIEVPVCGGDLMIGLIISKKGLLKPIDLKSLTTSLNYMRPAILDEVLIPVIKKRYKMRLNKTLQHTGLNLGLTDNINDLYPEGGEVEDCVQYVDINFGVKSANRRGDTRGLRTTRKFICNGDFEFYLRHVETNCIMIMGRM